MTNSNSLQDDTGFGLFGPPAITPPDVFAAAAISPIASKAAAMVQTLYVTEPGTGAPVSVADINQDQLGDCYLLSSIGEIALLKPSFISGAIHLNGSGTEAVTLYRPTQSYSHGIYTTGFNAVTETVANSFPTNSVNSGATQDVVGNQKEIWPQVLENAYASLNGGYNAIGNGGSPVVAMEELTGHAASAMSPASLTLASLQSDVSAGDLIVMDTLNRNGLSNGLYGDHAYMFDGVKGTGTAATLTLLNPWGIDQPTPILLSQLSKSFAEVDLGHLT